MAKYRSNEPTVPLKNYRATASVCRDTLQLCREDKPVLVIFLFDFDFLDNVRAFC